MGGVIISSDHASVLCSYPHDGSTMSKRSALLRAWVYPPLHRPSHLHLHSTPIPPPTRHPTLHPSRPPPFPPRTRDKILASVLPVLLSGAILREDLQQARVLPKVASAVLVAVYCSTRSKTINLHTTAMYYSPYVENNGQQIRKHPLTQDPQNVFDCAHSPLYLLKKSTTYSQVCVPGCQAKGVNSVTSWCDSNILHVVEWNVPCS